MFSKLALKIVEKNSNSKLQLIDNRFTNIQKIRLVLGVGRSGTSWISKVLSNSKVPTRSIQEPLTQMGITPSALNGRMSIDYWKNERYLHLLKNAYELCTQNNIDWKAVFPNKKTRDIKVFKNPKNPQTTIIKEVHSLLATEEIINKTNAPTILVIRNPIMVADSHISISGFKSAELDTNWLNIRANEFIPKYFPKKKVEIQSRILKIEKVRDKKEQFLNKKVYINHLINLFFKKLGKNKKQARVVRYEDVCTNPVLEYQKMAKHLEIPFDTKMKKYLEKTNLKTGAQTGNYSVYKNLKKQQIKKTTNLSDSQITNLNKIINK